MSKILLVEDDFPLMRLYQAALLNEHDVAIAATCQEAITLANQFQPDLVILDLNLPDAPGATLIQAVEQNPSLAHTRMIAMTGFSHLQKNKLPAIVIELLSKPVTTSTLLRVVKAALPIQQSS